MKAATTAMMTMTMTMTITTMKWTKTTAMKKATKKKHSRLCVGAEESTVMQNKVEMARKGMTFPFSSLCFATERFEAVYPTLKEIALTGSWGSKGMKQTMQQILQFAVKAAAEGKTNLISYLMNDLYLDNLEAWHEQLVKHFTLEPSKNEKALSLRRMLYAWPPSGMHKSTAMCSWDNCRETMDA
ncbi:hypothetical protein RHSIM_Rhsim03G0182700 [Rhododendron simsii]|uniref:Uncharacterized protein n=1 Tax=Rhododendron simsii TaxID=118357 RepID=A0A834HBR7_RHOSS|nr:hypothetical protein RHSIM_Rhsim03G0182700 [Rhododendron simsii]